MTRVVVCPVCEGKGRVQRGFYILGVVVATGKIGESSYSEQCQSCQGKGYLVIEIKEE